MSHALGKRSSGPQPRLMLVTSDRFCHSVVSEVLLHHGFPPAHHNTSVHAMIAGVSDDSADLVLIDETVGDMTPFEAVRMLRASGQAQKPPKTVLLASQATRSTVEMAREAGFDALVAKPVSPTPLLRTLRALTVEPYRA